MLVNQCQIHIERSVWNLVTRFNMLFFMSPLRCSLRGHSPTSQMKAKCFVKGNLVVEKCLVCVEQLGIVFVRCCSCCLRGLAVILDVKHDDCSETTKWNEIVFYSEFECYLENRICCSWPLNELSWGRCCASWRGIQMLPRTGDGGHRYISRQIMSQHYYTK